MARAKAFATVGIIALLAVLPIRFFPPSGVLVAVLVLILSLWLFPDLSRLPITRTEWLQMAALAGAVAMNYLLAMQRHRAVLTASILFLYLVVHLFVRIHLSEHQHRILLRGLALLSGGCALWALNQKIYGIPEMLDLLGHVDLPDADLIAARLRSGRVFGTFILPSAFGSFLILALPVTGWCLARANAWRGRIGWGAIAGLQAWALFQTQSHGAVLSLLFSLVLVALFGAPRRWRMTILGGALLTGLILSAVVIARGGILLDPSGPVGQRWGVWKSAWNMILAHPWFGVGAGGFGIAFPQYRIEGINETQFVHNSFLQLVTEYGVWILVPLFLILAKSLPLFLNPGRGRPGMGRELFLGVGCLAYLIHNLVDFSFFLPETAVPFLVVSGVLSLAPGRPEEREVQSGRRGPAGLLLVVAAAGFWIFSGSLFLSDFFLHKGKRSFQEGDGEAAIQSLDRAIALHPGRPGVWGVRASVAYQMAGADPDALARALEFATRAQELDPFTPFRHAMIGRISYSLGDDSAAYLSLRRASRLYPLQVDYRRQLAEVEKRIGTSPEPER